MGAILDLTGKRFGSLTAVRYVGKRGGESIWECKCDCGGKTESSTSNLTGGLSTSCGCKRKKTCSDRMKRINYKHGGTNTRLFRIWSGIKTRCFDENAPEYKNYGGRGITLHDLWKADFSEFQKWAAESGYNDTLTIDRIDVNGNYEPGNCRWVTMKEQANNKRTNRLISFNGETHSVSEWEQLKGAPRDSIRRRLNAGWSIERALTEPPHKCRKKVL